MAWKPVLFDRYRAPGTKKRLVSIWLTRSEWDTIEEIARRNVKMNRDGYPRVGIVATEMLRLALEVIERDRYE